MKVFLILSIIGANLTFIHSSLKSKGSIKWHNESEFLNWESMVHFYMIGKHITVLGIVSECVGTLIAPNWVLSAAHCATEMEVSPFEPWRFLHVVISGTFDSTNSTSIFRNLVLEKGTAFTIDDLKQRFYEWFVTTNFNSAEWVAAEVFIHERYKMISSDIVLIKLREPFLTWKPYLTIGTGILKIGSKCHTGVWGHKKEITYNQTMKLESFALKSFGYEWTQEVSEFDNNYIYTKKMPKNNDILGVSFGDAGEPLICNGKQYGIVSFLIPTLQDAYLVAWTRVGRYVPWMARVLKPYGVTFKSDDLSKMTYFDRDVSEQNQVDPYNVVQ